MGDSKMLLGELTGKVNAIINSGAKSKSVVNQISHVMEQLESTYNCEIDYEKLNFAIAESTQKKKYNKAFGSGVDILEKLLVFQRMFYELGGEVDPNVVQRYSLLLCERGSIHKTLLEGLGDISDSIEFPFRMWLNLPLAVNVMQLEKFREATEKTMRVICKNLEKEIVEGGEKGLMPFWVFNTDVIGNEDKWREIIREWEISYLVYKSHHVDGLSKTDIVENMKHIKGLFTNPDDKSNSI
ncbi:MAG TPA: hypothetical protein VJ550_13875, partial [Geomonas sp.]|nr:hypothetical protein [Geomonas sp.]